jgi:hypothetical protein
VKYLIAALSVVVIASLNLILLPGAGIRDPGSRPFFGGLVTAMDLALVSSSALLGLRFLSRGNRPFAALFALNLVLFSAAFVVVALGGRLHPLVLYAADLYWLNLYPVCLARHWRTVVAFSGTAAAPVDSV